MNLSNQTEKNDVKTKKNIFKAGGTFVECIFIVLCILATLIFSAGLFTFKPKFEKEKYPFEIMEALDDLENKEGMIHMQRKRVEMVSKALKDGVITSKDLHQNGDDWVKEQNLRINIREAKIYWFQLQALGEEARFGISTAQKFEAERLSKLIEKQFDMPYAKEEGLTVLKSDLEFCLYRVSHHGSKPEKLKPPALLGK